MRLWPGSRRRHAPAPFVVGVGRSGTTLLRLMLDAHPLLAIPPETGFIPDLIAAARRGAPTRRLVGVVTSHQRWGDFDLAEDELRRRFRAAAGDPGDVVRAFYEACAAKEGKPRWGDKTPGYTVHMRDIESVLPEARFVHIIRDGRDVAVSRMTELALKPRRAEDMARRWRSRIEEARRQAPGLGGYLEIRYERLVTDPEPVLREVCALCELDFDPAMLTYHERAPERLAELRRDTPAAQNRLPRPAERRQAMHERTAEPPNPARIGRWRDELTPADLAAFEREAGGLLRELGYA